MDFKNIIIKKKFKTITLTIYFILTLPFMNYKLCNHLSQTKKGNE